MHCIEIHFELFRYGVFWDSKDGTNMLDTVLAKLDHLTDPESVMPSINSSESKPRDWMEKNGDLQQAVNPINEYNYTHSLSLILTYLSFTLQLALLLTS